MPSPTNFPKSQQMHRPREWLATWQIREFEDSSSLVGCCSSPPSIGDELHHSTAVDISTTPAAIFYMTMPSHMKPSLDE